jgi:enoyl-CoA hydratase/carnithine racemase
MSSKLLVETRDRVVRLTINPFATGKIKEPIDRALDAGLYGVLENERFHPQDIFRTEDFKEGAAAFLEECAAIQQSR